MTALTHRSTPVDQLGVPYAITGSDGLVRQFLIQALTLVDQTGAAAGAGTAASPTIVQSANPATIYSGQQTITASAVALPSQALTNGLVITAPSGNAGTVYVGPSGVTTGTGYKLVPGTSISYAVTNASAIFVIGTAADTVSFTGN